MRADPERRALLAALRGDGLPAPLTQTQWESLSRTAIDHGVGQSLLTSFGSDLPDDQQARLRSDALVSAAKHLRTRLDLARIGPLLDGAAVPWVAVKGPVLSEHWFADRGRRPYGDLDLLVSGAGLSDVLDVLQGAGCRLLDTNWTLSLSQRRAELTVLLPHGTPLDLHWHLVNHPDDRANLRLDMAGMLVRRQLVSIAGQAVPTLDHADTLLHLSLHTLLSGGRRLAWYVDLAQVLRDFQAWDQLVDRSVVAQAGLLVGLALDRTRRLTGAPVPEEVIDRLTPHGRAWLMSVRRLDAVRPVGDPRVRFLTGQLVVRSARGGTAGSLAAVLRSVRRDLLLPLVREPRHPWLSRTPAPAEADNPLWSAADDPADRTRYLQFAGTG